jgi:hypothetical protein
MKSKLGPTILLVGCAALLALLMFLFLPRRSHFPSLPTPNGYDVLVTEAAKIVRSSTGTKDMSSNQLAAVVVTNEAVVRAVREALNLPSILPVELTEKWVSSPHLQNRINLKAVASALDAEATLCRLRGDSTNSLSLYIDQIRLGHAMMSGGVLIDYMVGSAVEAWGSSRITNLLSNLTADDCRRAAGLLSELDNNRDSFEAFTARELEWQRNAYSAFHRFKLGFRKYVLRDSDPFGDMAGDPEVVYKRRGLEFRRLLLKLATRAYQLENGHNPSTASELVPAYLKAIPLNPETGTPLQLP